MDNYRTTCCKARAERLGRASYICSHCKEDVSMEYFLIAQHYAKVKKYTTDKNKNSKY